METFAGFAEHTDYEVGRLVAQLEDRSNKIGLERYTITAPQALCGRCLPNSARRSIARSGDESAFTLGGQARLVAVHTLSALGTEDRLVTSSIPVALRDRERKRAPSTRRSRAA